MFALESDPLWLMGSRLAAVVATATLVAVLSGCGSYQSGAIEADAYRVWGHYKHIGCHSYGQRRLYLCILQNSKTAPEADDGRVCAAVVHNEVRYVPVRRCGISAPGLWASGAPARSPG